MAHFAIASAYRFLFFPGPLVHVVMAFNGVDSTRVLTSPFWLDTAVPVSDPGGKFGRGSP